MGVVRRHSIFQILLVDAGMHVAETASLKHVEGRCHLDAHVNHHGLQNIHIKSPCVPVSIISHNPASAVLVGQGRSSATEA